MEMLQQPPPDGSATMAVAHVLLSHHQHQLHLLPLLLPLQQQQQQSMQTIALARCC